MSFFEDITNLISTENQKKAIAILEEFLNKNESEPLAYVYLGLAYFLAGEETKAQEFWADLLLSFNNGVNALIPVLEKEATDRLKKRQFHTAQLLWQIIIDLDGSPDAFIALGDSLSQQGLYDEAIDSWDNALKLDPSKIEVYFRQGEIWLVLNEFDKAINVYQHFLENIDHRNGDVLYHLASAFQAVGQWQKALDCLNECLAINWGQTKVFGEIAMIFLRAGYQKEAFQYLSEMVGQNNQIFESILTGLKQIIRGEVKTNKELLLIRCSLLKALLSGEEVVDFCQQLTALNNLIKKSLKNNTIFKESELKGFYERTQDWVTSQEFGSFYPALPESFIRFLPPHTLDKFIHYSFRFGVGISLPETFVVSIPQGRVWLNKDESRMAIITPDNNLLGDLSPESPALSPNHPDKHPSRHSLLQRSKLPPVQSVSGTVAVLSGLLNDVYFHWLFDLLPRFYLLQLAGWHWDDIDWFVVNNQLPFQEESLAMLGVPAAKVIHHSGQVDLHLQADNLLVPSFPGTVAWMPRWACDFLRDTFLSSKSVQPKPNKRIYIRRNLSSSRRLINEEEVITCLERLGFEAINLELLSMQEQANLFVQAEIVVAPHGSGLSNLVFCSPGTKVVEIFSPFYVYPCFWLVSNLMELSYSYVLGDILGSDHFHQLLLGGEREGDIWVDCQHLLKILRLAKIK